MRSHAMVKQFLAVVAGLMICGVVVAHADQVTVPIMAKAPTIDGKIDPAEWADAARIDGVTGGDEKLEWRSVHTYIGATADTLFVAIQSKLPDDGPLLELVEHDGMKVVYDDSAEFWIDPAPAGVDRVMYQMIANAIGHAGFGTQTRGKASEDLNWAGNWKQASTQSDGYWNIECAIPISSMSHAGTGRQATGGTWLINLCRNWRQPWMSSSYTGGNYLWNGLTVHFTTGNGPIVQQIIDGDPTRPQNGGASLHLVIRNPTASPMALKAGLELTRNNMPAVNEDQTLTLAAGEEKKLDISIDSNDPTTINDLKAMVSSSDGKEVYFDRSLRWNKSATANRWATEKPKEPPLVDLQFGYYPSKNHMRVLANISALPSGTTPQKVSAIVRDRLTGKEIKTVDFPLNQFKNGQQELAFDLPPLNGMYEIVVQASGDKMKTVEATKPFERQVFPWENLPTGTSTKIYPPFTPIELKDKKLSTVLRTYDLDDSGLIDQVAATNSNTNVTKDILAAPMHYRVSAGGKDLLCNAEPMKTVSSSPDSAEFTGTIKGDLAACPFAAIFDDKWDYDGTVKVSLTLQPTNGKSIDGLTLEIPLRGDVAKLVHANSDRIRAPIAQEIPQGNGIVWDGSKVACDEYIKNFCPYVFLGDGNRGLCWFADNDRNWGWDPATPNLDVVRQGDQVLLRVHLINKPTVITEPRTLVYGLLASPVKPKLNLDANPNWYRYRFYRDGYRLLGTDINWFGNHSCGTVYPAGKDLYLWEMIARGSREKIPDDEVTAFGLYGSKYFQNYGADKVQLFKDHVNLNLRSHLHDRMIFYYNRASCPELAEFETFKDEWCLDDYRSLEKSTSRDEIKVVPSTSFINYNLYWNALSFDVGANKGVYWDNWFIAPSFNTEMTDAYRAPDGHIVPAAGIWAMREQAKRTFIMMNEKGMPPIVFPHITSFACLPMLSFATAHYEWEWKYSEGDVQDRFSRDYLQLVTIGQQSGTWPVPLSDQLKLANDPWTERTFTAVRLLHELDGYGGFDVAKALLKPVIAIIDHPTTIAYHYWEDRPMPAHCANADIPLLVYADPGKEALIVACSYDAADAVARFDVDWKTLGLDAKSTITDAETGETIGTQGEQIVLRVKKHDVRLIHIVRQGS